VLVRAVLAPQRTHDSQLREGRLPAQHLDETTVLVVREPVFRDQRRRDEWVAGPGLDLHVRRGHALGFFGFSGFGGSGVLSGFDSLVPCRASAAEIMRGELLVPE